MTGTDPTPDVAELLALGRDREAARRGAGLVGSPHPTTTGGPMHPLDQFAQLAPVLGGVVAGILPDQLDAPTPCAGFDVRGVLEHMIGGATVFAAAYRGEAEPPAPDVEDPVGGVARALGELAEAVSAPGALERTLSTPFGEMDGETFARYVVLDGLVHGWDLATATGQAYDPPDALVAEADAFARRTIDPFRDGDTFATAVDPSPTATPIERLAAFTGRRAAAKEQP